MTLLKAKDAREMNAEDKKSKMSELRMELIKANVTAHKQTAKTREIKKAIARLLTASKQTAKEVSGK